MIGLLDAELRKLRSVRSTWVLTLIGWALVAVSALPIVLGLFGSFDGTADQVADAFTAIGSNSVIVLVVGLLSMTTEFRHGTVGRTLQITPSRTRVLVAKLAGSAVYAVVFAVGAALVVALFVGVVALVTGVSLSVDGATFETIWQGTVGLALTALIGVAFGALVRAQVVAVVVTLVWIFVVESVVAAFWPHIGRWLPFQALNSLFVPDAMVSQMPDGSFLPFTGLTALGLFTAYVAAFTVASAILLRVRDV